MPQSLSRSAAILIAALAAALVLGVPPSPAEAKTVKGVFASCSALNAKYPGGIAKTAAAARRTPGDQKVSKRLYRLNARLDGDKDRVACEPRPRAARPAPVVQPAPKPAPVAVDPVATPPAPAPVWRTSTQTSSGSATCPRGTLLSGSVETPVNGWTYESFWYRIDYRVTQSGTGPTKFWANGVKVKTVIANGWTPSDAVIGSQTTEYWTPSVRIMCGYWE